MLFVGGQLRWEHYWEGCGPDSRFNTFSIAKAFTALAVGVLDAEGALSVDDPACRYLPEWAGDARRDITLRHLLTMTSGLALDERRFHEAPDPTAAALGWPLAHRPGQVWCYESATAQALVPIIVRIAGRQPIDLLRERLLDPIGARGVEWSRSASGDCLGGLGLLASASDLARVGELLLRRGRLRGRTVLDERFVARMTAVDPITAHARADTPRDEFRRRGYGWLVYLNAGGMWPGVDREAFALLGAYGNVCLVDPRRDFVFVRMVTPESLVRSDGEVDEALFDNPLEVTDAGTAKLWRTLLRAFPRPAPDPLGGADSLRRRAVYAGYDFLGRLRVGARRRGFHF
jgi:CubicO group peptidase (beta-lactamase class C family)